MFRKILIANRGEIARRIARTCRRMGIAVAGVHSDADRDAPHVREIGESVRLGPAPPRESYLAIDRVVAAARAVGADAVHPGYGFLAENAAFAQALDDAGIAFVGPSADTLRAFGDKAAAKRLAQQSGLPTIPGAAAASADPAEVAAQVRELGFPVLLKAAAGGGGKGIRVLHSDAGIADAIAAAMREGLGAFGDPALLVERYLARGRHVEVQILGDGSGHVLHLWERECSLQRRHQKVIEEAPALPLPAGMRERLLDAAVALGARVRYRALGTVEFLVTGDAFHFLEVNPRLQVEHPTTEAVTGLDLVELQLRAAAGEPLPLAQHELRCSGHAIEARLYAEDPTQGFVPSTGRLRHLALPHAIARVESGVEPGSPITPDYDPMFAKLIAHGTDRRSAIARLREALAATRVCGVANNLGFLERLLAAPQVADDVPDTGTVDALRAQAAAAPAWREHAGAIAAAYLLRRARGAGPETCAAAWPAFTHWRLGGAAQPMPLHPQFDVVEQGRSTPVTVGGADPAGRRWRVASGDAGHDIGFGLEADDGATMVSVDTVATRLWIGADGDDVWLCDGRLTATLRVRPALKAAHAGTAAAGAEVRAPLTGKVLEVRVAEGQPVRPGDLLAILESMKMELRITAPHAGTVCALAARAGAMVDRGALLLRVDAGAAAQ